MNSRAARGIAAMALLLGLAVGAAMDRTTASPGPPGAGSPSTRGVGFRRVDAPYPWSFPRDHGAHPDFQTEWWYYTGHLATTEGRSFGYELTIFRRAPGRPEDLGPGFTGWEPAEFYPAHFAITDETGRTFRHWERIRRNVGGVAGADTTGLRAWCGDWSAVGRGASHRLEASADGWALSLDLEPQKPPILHGEGGLSRKGPQTGQASYYYSMTRMVTRGTLRVDGRLSAVRGLSWMDHEFFSSDLDTTLAGWDWFSLQLGDDTELMLYRLRRSGATTGDWISGTCVLPNADALALRQHDVSITATGSWRSPATSITYPSGWRIRVPQFGLDLAVTPTVLEQELDTRATTGVIYWEGSVTVRGQRGARPLTGVGYVELTGYDGAVPMKSPPVRSSPGAPR